MNAAYDKCFQETTVRGLTLRNRFVKAATFEGMTPQGIPGESLTRLHRRMGEGGVGQAWIGAEGCHAALLTFGIDGKEGGVCHACRAVGLAASHGLRGAEGEEQGQDQRKAGHGGT